MNDTGKALAVAAHRGRIEIGNVLRILCAISPKSTDIIDVEERLAKVSASLRNAVEDAVVEHFEANSQRKSHKPREMRDE